MSAKKTAGNETPFQNPFAEFMGDTKDVHSCDMPILPEMVLACLENLAAFKHQSASGVVQSGPSQWALEYLSRILRDDPHVMLEAVIMQVGSEHQQLEQEAMRAARMLVVNSSVMKGDEVVFLTRFEVLELMEKFEPRLYKAIPEKKRARTDWWKRSRLDFLKQSRGEARSAAYTKLVGSIKRR